MSAVALMAFLHHLAAFTLVAALAVETVLFAPPLSLPQARRLMRTDSLVGIAASALLIVGLLRVSYFEKGPGYYWHDLYFQLKFAAFLLAALVSIYPTLLFLGWRRALRAGHAPEVCATQAQRVRLCLALELAAIVVILACAALMARGFGYRAAT
jgi:putative membrane protein